MEETHRNNIYNNWFKNYGLSSLEINEFCLTKEFQIVRHSWYGNKVFFNQKQLWEAYSKLESKFNDLELKKKQQLNNQKSKQRESESNLDNSNEEQPWRLDQEQNRPEMSSTDTNQQKSDLNNKIHSLEKEIKDLESNQAEPNSQSFLNSKKRELANLKKELNSLNQVQENSNAKLYLGIGLGILGMGLIGLIFWLIFRNRKE